MRVFCLWVSGTYGCGVLSRGWLYQPKYRFDCGLVKMWYEIGVLSCGSGGKGVGFCLLHG